MISKVHYVQLNISYFKSLLLFQLYLSTDYGLKTQQMAPFSSFSSNFITLPLFEFSHLSSEKQELRCCFDDSIIIQCQRCCEKQVCTLRYQIKAVKSPPSRYAVNEAQSSFRGQV